MGDPLLGIAELFRKRAATAMGNAITANHADEL